MSPTRFAPNSRPALLDIVCRPDTSLVLHYDQFPTGGLADRGMSFGTYNIELISDASASFICRHLNDFNLRELALASSKICWSNMQCFVDINDKLRYLTSNLLKLLYEHVPNMPKPRTLSG